MDRRGVTLALQRRLWQSRPMLHLLALFTVLLVPAVALAQASLPSDPSALLTWFAETHAAGHWSLLIGGALTLFLRFAPLVKPLLDKLPAETTKWVAMGVAMVGSIATGLMAGVPLYKVMITGAQVGAAAIGGWELILKPLLTRFGMQKAAGA
jgi:hypothetical protein